MNIPRRALGFVYKQCKSKSDTVVKLTAFLDFTCPDSKRAFPVLLDLGDRLSGKNFELIVQSFSLPYHRHSHAITKLMHLINKKTEGKGVFPFMSDVYDQLDNMTPTALMDKTENEILDDILIPPAAILTNMSIDKTKDEFSQRAYEMAARLDFKYSCTRGVYGTPTFMVNDVVLVADQTWSIQDWLSVIDPLL